MISPKSGQIGVESPQGEGETAQSGTGTTHVNPEAIELSPEQRAELLDPAGWVTVLETYARTTRLAVALTDCEGYPIGRCHNPQAIWSAARSASDQAKQASKEGDSACWFCLAPPVPCRAVADALKTGRVVVVRDSAGLTHVAVGLSLEGHWLGALIAGQVFDRYPEPLPLQRAARQIGVPPQRLWQEARRQAPISRNTLLVYGDLLQSLGQAFIRQTYAGILERKLTETNRRHLLLIDGVKDYALFTVNIAGCVTSWNHGAERLFGYTEADILGRNFACLFTPEDINSGALKAELGKAARDGWADDQGWQVRKDGSRFFGMGSVTLLGKGERREFGRMMHDVTESRNAKEALLQAQKLENIAILERRVDERTRELAQSNKDLRNANHDLEQFAYSASHDLQEPLRNVAAYGQLFKKLYKDKLDNQAEEFLGYMIDGAKRMGLLVRDLLAYTTVTVASEHPSTMVAGDVALEKALCNLDAAIEESKASITSSELPTVEVQEVHLQQLFQNLIGNAIKYRKPEEPPSIHISAERRAGAWLFSVKDNGIGIDSQYTKQIFGIFKRLHAPHQYSGTGIGLSICKRIVERYRGEIWAESEPGEGSTFRFTLPA